MTSRLAALLLCIILVITLLLSACTQPQPGSGGPLAPQVDTVTVQLSWFPTVEFAGFYVAQQQGFYTAEHLDVKLLAGSPTATPLQAVSSGQAQFGVNSGDGILRSQASGEDLIAVASIFRQSPLVVMSLTRSNIKNPWDLTGKTVGVISPAMDTTWDIAFLAMLDKLGIDPQGMTFVPIEDYHGANDLKSGRMQAASGFFYTNEGIQAELDGDAINQIYYSDYGVLLYINTIFTSGDLVRENPDLVARFVRATLRGYQYAIEHPDQAVSDTLKYDPELEPDLQTATMQAQIPLIDTGDAPLGWMDASVWQNTLDTLLEQSILSTSVDLNRVYTNQFIPAGQ